MEPVISREGNSYSLSLPVFAVVVVVSSVSAGFAMMGASVMSGDLVDGGGTTLVVVAAAVVVVALVVMFALV